MLRFFDGRATMRSIADGLEKLHELQTDLGDGPITIMISPLRLPTGEITSGIVLVAQRTSASVRWAIDLPSSAHFYATTTLGARQRYDTTLLDGAIVDIDGNVRLTSDFHLHNVELVPTTLRPDLTKRQERILYLTIFALKAKDRCFRPVHPSLLGIVGLDFSTLQSVKLPSLKDLTRQIAKDMPNVTRHEIANALAVAGMRLPRSGRRANR
jgi:ParB/Sulfiredoxin domain